MFVKIALKEVATNSKFWKQADRDAYDKSGLEEDYPHTYRVTDISAITSVDLQGKVAVFNEDNGKAELMDGETLVYSKPK